MKKIIALTAFMMLASYGTSNAVSDDVKIMINNSEFVCEQAPFIDDGTTLVPMRAIFEKLGASVEWDGNTRTIRSEKSGKIIEMQIDNFNMSVSDGDKKNHVTLEKSPVIVDDFTFIPLRAVAEAFDSDVKWDGSTRTVSITYAQETEQPTASPSPTPENTQKPSPDETQEPTPAPSESTSPTAYSSMYDGTEFEFIKNIPELTCDFESDNGRFNESAKCKLGKDFNGNGVFYVQSSSEKMSVNTSTKATRDHLFSLEDGEIYDISFDFYCPNINGTSTFMLLGNSEEQYLTLKLLSNGTELKVNNESFDLLDGNTYFNNNTDGDAEDITIENSAHVNIKMYYPHKNTLTLTIKNNGNDSEAVVKRYHLYSSIHYTSFSDGVFINAQAKPKLWGLKFETSYFINLKPCFIDNLVTNVIKEKAE